MKKTLYAVDKKGSYKEWSVETVGEKIFVRHGKLGGKIQEKVFIAKPKNVGRANETTAEDQAVAEAISRANKQFDKGYRKSLELADEASLEYRLPMLASDFTKVGKSIKFPCFVSPKLDGVRCIARVGDKYQVTLTSRGGKEYPVPPHIRMVLVNLKKATGISVFDGELYIHGLSLQNIVSAVKKPNENTADLQFWIFDIPTEEEFSVRNDKLEYLQNLFRNAGDAFRRILKIVLNEVAENQQHAREFMNQWLEEGFEGMMLRNVDGMYEWNHRSRDLQKWKDFKDAEFKVFAYEEDNLGEAVFHMEIYENQSFKAKPRGTHEYRSVENVHTFLGKWVTVRYQQLTDDGIPQFPVIISVRDCDEKGLPLE